MIGALEDVAQREMGGADVPAHVGHRVEDLRPDAGDPEDDRDPRQPRDAALDGADPADAGKGSAQDAHAEADDDERDQDRDRDLEHRRLDRPREHDARRVRQGEREKREEEAVEDAVAEPDRGDRPVAAAQQPDDDPGDGQATDEDSELGDGARAAQPDDELVELAVVEGMDHGPAPGRPRPGAPRCEAANEERVGAPSRHQDAQVRGDAARERAEVVAALEARDDAAAGVLVGDAP